MLQPPSKAYPTKKLVGAEGPYCRSTVEDPPRLGVMLAGHQSLSYLVLFLEMQCAKPKEAERVKSSYADTTLIYANASKYTIM
jgi:hypothetical protein